MMTLNDMGRVSSNIPLNNYNSSSSYFPSRPLLPSTVTDPSITSSNSLVQPRYWVSCEVPNEPV